MADVVEALMGAVFLDGGWNALAQVFGRIVTPMIYFCCRYFNQIATDLIHDIIQFYDQKGNFFHLKKLNCNFQA